MFEWLKKYKDRQSIIAFCAVVVVLICFLVSMPYWWPWLLLIFIGYILLFYFMKNNP